MFASCMKFRPFSGSSTMLCSGYHLSERRRLTFNLQRLADDLHLLADIADQQPDIDADCLIDGQVDLGNFIPFESGMGSDELVRTRHKLREYIRACVICGRATCGAGTGMRQDDNSCRNRCAARVKGVSNNTR